MNSYELIQSFGSSGISPAPHPVYTGAEFGSGLIRNTEGSAVYPGSTAPAAFEFGTWHEGFRALETYSSTQQRAWDRDAIELKTRMELLESQTRTELRVLSSKVDLLTHNLYKTLVNISPFIGNPHESDAETDVRTIPEDADDSETELFNALANDVIDTTDLLKDRVKSSLAHFDPSVRAAAGRALCKIAPADALELMPAIIAQEKNPIVVSVLKGALRAIR